MQILAPQPSLQELITPNKHSISLVYQYDSALEMQIWLSSCCLSSSTALSSNFIYSLKVSAETFIQRKIELRPC